MDVSQEVAAVARLVGEKARAQMLLALLDGSPLTATELANMTEVSPQTVSSHLSQLVQGKLLSVESKGRHRYYRLAGVEVARVLESLMTFSSVNFKTYKRVDLDALQFARVCYDHLAGKLGIALTESLLRQGWLKSADNYYEVTPRGRTGFEKFGLDVAEMSEHKLVAPECLDWTEKRHHLAGALGTALTNIFLERKWLIKDKHSRIVHLTNEGQKGFAKVFGVRL
jgi:DNA-binding transcriptional ArsR family regulator